MSVYEQLSEAARDVLDALAMSSESTELLRDFVAPPDAAPADDERGDRATVEAAVGELVALGLVERAVCDERFFAGAFRDPEALDEDTRRIYLQEWWQLTEPGWALYESDPQAYFATFTLCVEGIVPKGALRALTTALDPEGRSDAIDPPRLRGNEHGETWIMLRCTVTASSPHNARKLADELYSPASRAFTEALGDPSRVRDSGLTVSHTDDPDMWQNWGRVIA
jgi:hypothetical protein